MNCPICGRKLRRHYTPEGEYLYWCEKCGKYIDYEEEEEKEEDKPAGGKYGTNSE